MAGNSNLGKAKTGKNDEFYTQLSDIEAELKHYRKHFKDKIVFCNCDDPYESNFFKYFAMNFNYLGLKKLIATCYKGSPITYTQLNMFGDEKIVRVVKKEKTPYKIEITEVVDANGDGAVDLTDIEYLLQNNKNTLLLLNGDGDFRSEECIELLKEADVVVTNPPFSLFREYVAQLFEFEKNFIILSNMNAITYKEIFPLLKDNKMWIGYGFNMSMVYKTPYPNLLDANRKFVIAKGFNPDDGYLKVPAICWFTNLDHNKRHETLDLYKKYTPEEYPRYDNYNVINIDKVADIPEDYFGVMGVPITFLDKYNPDQFEILGITLGNTVDYPMTNIYKNAIQHNKNGTTQGGSKVNTRAAILVKEKPVDTVYYTADGVDGYLLSIYPRILIRRKQNGNQIV